MSTTNGNENIPLSPTRRPGVNLSKLNTDTGYKTTSRSQSNQNLRPSTKQGERAVYSEPPRTPPRGSSRFATGSPRSKDTRRRVEDSPRQTFLDDMTPIDFARQQQAQTQAPGQNHTRYSESDDSGDENRKDSHDLRAPETITRDSLVDNMLLSLDQLQFDLPGATSSPFGLMSADEARLYSSFTDDAYSSYGQGLTQSQQGPTGGRGHSHSFSYDDVDTASRTSSGGYARGRRSNSSSNFTPTITQSTSRPAFSPTQAQGPRVLHSRKGQGSKGSSNASFDLGYATVSAPQRWRAGSGSYEYGSRTGTMTTAIYGMQREEEEYDPYEAAPTPTVPVGPRKFESMSPVLRTPSHMEMPPPPKPLPQESSAVKKGRSATMTGPQSTKRLGSSHSTVPQHTLRTAQSQSVIPPVPTLARKDEPPLPPAPAPSVGYGKSKDPPVVQPVKKEGFFRRVFGGSKNNLASHTTAGLTNSVSANSLSGIENRQTKTSHGHPTSSPTGTPQREPQLKKMPSSFFRRRKKSVSEPEVPALPINLQPPVLGGWGDDRAVGVESPTSSLRMALNPYLHSPTRVGKEGALETVQAQAERYWDAEEEADREREEPTGRRMRGFSPEYQPDPTATIRSVRSKGQLPRSNLSHGTLSAETQTDTETEAEEEREITMKNFLDEPRRTPAMQMPGSFLRDESGDEREHIQALSDYERQRIEAAVLEREHENSQPQKKQEKSERPQLERKDTLEVQQERERERSKSPNSLVNIERDLAMVREYEQKHATRKSPTPSRQRENPMLSLYPSTTSPKSPTSSPKVAQMESADKARGLDSTASTPAAFYSATSLPLVNVQEDEDSAAADMTVVPGTPPKSPVSMTKSEPVESKDDFDVTADSPPPIIADEKTPTSGDRDRAKMIFEGDEGFIQKTKAAAWMGEEGGLRSRTLIAYMALYDFANQSILSGLRLLCSKLVLRAESQQVDRILDAFAQRWCECNPTHGFRVTDVVHTICYSILLLNTDIYLADQERRMTRGQFVKNTMSAVLKVVADAKPEAFGTERMSILPGKGFAADSEGGAVRPSVDGAGRQSLDVDRPSTNWRNSMRPGALAGQIATTGDDCGPLVKTPFHGTIRQWEVAVEAVLKDFYNSIRAERLPLFGAETEQKSAAASSLSVLTQSLRRTPSVISKAGSESGYARGRTATGDRTVGHRAASAWGGASAKNSRSKGRMGGSTLTLGAASSSRTSFDDNGSVWSPSLSSSTWSKYSLGKGASAMSVTSLNASSDGGYGGGDYQSSIGFANALSQAIIREETGGGAGGRPQSADGEGAGEHPLLEDDSLELMGAPWAKEGRLVHKHHLESAGKKAKERHWVEVFAVVEKGFMTLFSFSSHSKSLSKKSLAKHNKPGGGGLVVGGGNWQSNAENLGSFLLRQTIASVLPKPGYSKQRPNVWALSLPTGAVHLFQVGTEDVGKEWVSAANYWSARLSNHPLVGAVSNVEFGWSEGLLASVGFVKGQQSPHQNHEDGSASESRSVPSTAAGERERAVSGNNPSMPPTTRERSRSSISGSRPSLQSSLRSSMEHSGSAFRLKASLLTLPGDRITLADWTAPTQSMRPSTLPASEQKGVLEEYVSGIERELAEHQAVRSMMSQCFSPRGVNAQKALGNWERKSSYLLREIVKFRTYIEALGAAERRKEEIYKEREEREAEKQERERAKAEREGMNIEGVEA